MSEAKNRREFLKRVQAVYSHRSDMDPVMLLEFIEEFHTWVDLVESETLERLMNDAKDE